MFLVILLMLVSASYSSALDCAVCTNITNPSDCHTTQQCTSGDRCFTKSSTVSGTTTFDLGCMSEQNCLGSSTSSIVGRSVTAGKCGQCCAVDYCNRRMCSAGTQGNTGVDSCSDDVNYNCEQISSLFNICADIQHAKAVCRRWCGLCDLVDGLWSMWSSWSKCAISCGTAQLTRSRTCTNPPPTHGGLDCLGNKTEIKLCTLEPCPIHGGWGSWKSWNSCSQTCGIGTQTRHRACDTPVPQLAGNHCFGDNVDFRTCFPKTCADGGWSSWSQWSNCTQGLRTRTRSCDNPPPSMLGRDCEGNNEEALGCTNNVAFTVSKPNHTLIDGRPFFTNTTINVGGGYDPTTAKFTCPVAGLYLFTFSVQSDGIHEVYCFIQKNGQNLIYPFTGHDNSYDTSTVSTFVQLVVGDVVSLGSCRNWANVYTDYVTSFSGALVGN